MEVVTMRSKLLTPTGEIVVSYALVFIVGLGAYYYFM
tara:strand:+ start:5338 stop:5448 length:111 start_codon:yes stop_codon:yes gene_type:complete